MRHLIVNADGYGFTDGITRAIEECVDFGTVRSLSANVNFPHASRLRSLVSRHPRLSVGCHLNPLVGRPVLPAATVPSLVDRDGYFHYRSFAGKVSRGEIDRDELRAELLAQIDRTRDLAGDAFSHVDFHMGLHRLPKIYPTFLEVAGRSGTGRIRTHRYVVGFETRRPRLRHGLHLLGGVSRLPKYAWNLLLRGRALQQGLAMPDRWIEITGRGFRPNTIDENVYAALVRRTPEGFNEFVVHPGYVDDELRRWSTYIDQRTEELRVLLHPTVKEAFETSGVRLSGYRDIPLRGASGSAAARRAAAAVDPKIVE
jgi:hypothetical protein